MKMKTSEIYAHVGPASPNDRQLRPACVEAFEDAGGLCLHAIVVHSAGWLVHGGKWEEGGVGGGKCEGSTCETNSSDKAERAKLVG